MDNPSPSPLSPPLVQKPFFINLLFGLVLFISGFIAGFVFDRAWVSRPPASPGPAPVAVVSPTPAAVTPAVPVDSGTSILESQEFTHASSGWITLRSQVIGLQFSYPLGPGKVIFNYRKFADNQADTAGRRFNWSLNGSGFAGGVSRDHRYPSEGGGLIFSGGDRTIWASATVKTYKTSFDTQAVLVVPPCELGTPEEECARQNIPGRMLYVYLPLSQADSATGLGGLAIYFPDGVSDSDAARVVKSISLE